MPTCSTTLRVAAAAEAATGLVLLVAPSLVGRLLLGRDLPGVPCWPAVVLHSILTPFLANDFFRKNNSQATYS